MFEFLMVASLLLTQGAAKSVALPDTPQGKLIQSYVDAFNSGDEKKFMAWFETSVSPAVLAKRSAEERAKMFQRMKGDFAKLVVTKVVKSTATQIQEAGGRGAAPQRTASGAVVVDLQPTAGVQDLYFVFRNPKASTDPLMTLSTITVVHGG